MRSAQQILDSVIEISEGRDAQQFRRSLGFTVREVLPIDAIAFIRPHAASHRLADTAHVLHIDASRNSAADALREELIHPDGPMGTEHLLDMIRAGEYTHHEAGTELLLLPVIHKEQLAEIIAVRAVQLPSEARYLLKGYVRLYRNFLGLLIEGQTDALTGLLSRKSLETELNSVIEEAKQAHAHAARQPEDQRRRQNDGIGSFLAVIDIDHFKQINDSFGHLFGDEVIILVARLMKEVFRTRDLLFRFGGEEFVAVMLSDSQPGVEAALQRFRQRIADHRFPQVGQVTVSIGFAEIQGDMAPSTVLGMADKALYYAKEHGRNRVCEYAELLRTGEVAEPTIPDDVDLF